MNRDMIHFSVSVCQREQVCSTNTQQDSLSLWAVSHQLHRTVAVRRHTDSKCTVKKSTDYNSIPKAVMECDSSSKCIKCIFEVALNSSNSIFCYVTLPLDFGEYYTFLSFMIIITEFIHFISNRIKKKNPLILMFRKRLNIQANNLFFTFYFWYLRKCNTPYFKTLAWVMLARWL